MPTTPSSCVFGHPRLPCLPQALAYLGTVWSVDLKARLHFRRVTQLEDATHIKVIAGFAWIRGAPRLACCTSKLWKHGVDCLQRDVRRN